MSEKKKIPISELGKKALEYQEKYRFLRLFVAEYLDQIRFESQSPISIDAQNQIALSAGIEFVNGTWILKEGE